MNTNTTSDMSKGVADAQETKEASVSHAAAHVVMKPATPLPWGLTIDDDIRSNNTAENDWTSEYVCTPVLTHYRKERRDERAPNARYIVHACNAYPKLVAFARMIYDYSNIDWKDYDAKYGETDHGDAAEALLRELGE